MDKISKLRNNLSSCSLCPRDCGVNRNKGEKGYCKAGKDLYIASCNLHFGEEPPITGVAGSGTIFFCHCSMGCVYCQNYPISHLGNGRFFSIQDIVDKILDLQKRGAHNINFVTPTHYAPQMAESVFLAKKNGLSIPIVYNCGGYEPIYILDLLDDFVDIYMTDMKYGIDDLANKYSNARDYVSINKKAVDFMLKQKGFLQINSKGIAEKGIIVRHMMLPGHIDNTLKVLDNLAEISQKVDISFMGQYHPAYNSDKFRNMNKRLSKKEYMIGVEYLEQKGFNKGWIQSLD
ncbi:radical SAM protein [bacterium]